MKKYVIGAIALSSLFVAGQANALGDKEKGALMGVFGLLTVQEIIRNQKHREQATHAPAPTTTYPPASGYYDYPSFEEFRRAQIEEAYRRGLEERRVRELEKEKQEAYQCALEGTC